MKKTAGALASALERYEKMDEQNIFELTEALIKQCQLQEEANGLMRELIPALQANAQELLELRQHLEKSQE